MKITFFSDTHTKHEKVQFSGSDVLIFCGDLTGRGELTEVKKFSKFVSNLNYQYKIVIAGNHDFSFDDNRKAEAEEIFLKDGIIYLNDSGIEINGIKFWGSPVQPCFHDWAFNRNRSEENRSTLEINSRRHAGINYTRTTIGCADLLNTIKRIKPKNHAFGHIHESYGTIKIDETLYVNACSLNEYYEYSNPEIDVEI